MPGFAVKRVYSIDGNPCLDSGWKEPPGFLINLLRFLTAVTFKYEHDHIFIDSKWSLQYCSYDWNKYSFGEGFKNKFLCYRLEKKEIKRR